MPFNSIVLNLLLKLDITLISIKFLKNYSNIFLINCLAKCLNQLKLVANMRHAKKHKKNLINPNWSNVQNVLICIQPKQLLLTLHILISAHADGGPRSPSAHAGPFARPPISMSGNFLALVSAESPSNISPNPSEVISEVSEP